MTAKEYDDFVAWWKAQWPISSPNRISVEKYLEYIKEIEEKGE